MIKDIDNFYLNQAEPIKGCMLALREIIMAQDDNISNVLKYGMPFFCYKGRMFCYMWFHKKYKQPYIGIVEGKYFDEPFLIQESRSRMKIILIDPDNDLPLPQIKQIIQKALNLYRAGTIKINK